MQKEPNDEDKIFSVSATASTGARGLSCGSGANERKQYSGAGLRKRGPGGRGSALERRLHDGSRPKPMRGAHVGLWQPRHRRWPNVQDPRKNAIIPGISMWPGGSHTYDGEWTRHMRVKLCARCPYTQEDLIGHYDPKAALHACAKCDGSQGVVTNKNARRSAIFSEAVGGTDFLSEAAHRKQHDRNTM